MGSNVPANTYIGSWKTKTCSWLEYPDHDNTRRTLPTLCMQPNNQHSRNRTCKPRSAPNRPSKKTHKISAHTEDTFKKWKTKQSRLLMLFHSSSIEQRAKKQMPSLQKTNKNYKRRPRKNLPSSHIRGRKTGLDQRTIRIKHQFGSLSSALDSVQISFASFFPVQSANA